MRVEMRLHLCHFTRHKHTQKKKSCEQQWAPSQISRNKCLPTSEENKINILYKMKFKSPILHL